MVFGRHRKHERGRAQQSRVYGSSRRGRDGRNETSEPGDVFEDVSAATADYLRTFADIAKGQALYFADRYRNQAAGIVDDFAASLRETSRRRASDGDDIPVVDAIAGGLEDISDIIRDLRLSSALAEVEAVIRRRPVVSALTAAAVAALALRLASGRTGLSQPSETGDARKKGWRFY